MKLEKNNQAKVPSSEFQVPSAAGRVTRPLQAIATRKSPLANSAFTLVEMLLVVTIIGILAALVVPKIMGRSEQARQTAARADISGIKTALDAFEVDNGYYPKSNNGLGDLVQAPRDAKNWRGPYLEKIPTDPWSNPYVYAYPGKHNSSSYDLLSVGPDGKEGTEDDIGNWQK